MGLFSGVIRCFCCDLKDEYQQNEQEPLLFPINHAAPTDTLHDQNGSRVHECQDYLSKLSAEPTDFSRVQNDLEFQECLDYHSDSSSSDSLQQQVQICPASFSSCENTSLHGTFQQHQEAAGLPCLLDSTTLVDESEFVEVKKQDEGLLEEMNSEEPNEEVQDGCFLEELHFEGQIEKKQGAYLLEVVLFKELIAKKQDVCFVEELHLKEPELIAKKHDVCFVEELRLKEPEWIAKKQDVCFLEELHLKEPIEKTQDARFLLEKLHFEEPVEKKQGVCLQEDLRCEKPIKEEVIKNLVAEERWIKHYSSSQKILLVGEGDFSFSASLAKAFGSAHNTTATSLDTKEFLRENYRRAISNIENLTNKGCRVIHDVDAKVMAKNPLLKGMKFDRIIFNFPFAGFFKEFPREYQLRKHRRLVSRFLKNAKEMIKQSGEIHITHKTNNFHSEWNIEQLASCHGLRLTEAVDFHHRDYPGYMTMCGFGGDNFFCCYPCKTYKFRLQIAHGPKKSRWEKKDSDCKMI